MLVTGGTADVTTYFQMRLTAGGDATGLTMADFDMSYTRTATATAAKVDCVALAAADTAHTDNRGIEVDATDCPGLYRFDWPDAAFAAGVAEVVCTIKHADCFTESLRVEIDAVQKKTDTISEMTQGVPPTTPTAEEAIMWLYMAWRNIRVTSQSQDEVNNDAGTVIAKAALSDSFATHTFTKGKYASGP